VKPRDLTDERLATPRDSLAVAERWVAFERDLTQAVLRVYDLPGRGVRVDTTTAGASVTPEGMCQLGHSKAHRPDLPQGKIAMAMLAPLGWPLTPTVVAGQPADDPRSLPEMAKVRQTAQRTGLPSVGDGTRAALGTRAESVAHQDSSLCPLSAQQRPEAELDRVLDPVFREVLKPSAICLPNADGALDEPDEPVALGFVYTVERRAPDHSGPSHTWPERRLVVRSLAFATTQEKPRRHRVARAVTASTTLDERKQGTQRGPDAATASQAAAAIMAKQRVDGLVHVTVMPDGHEPAKRRYGTRPATTVRRERVRGGAARAEAPLAHAVRRLGWRVSATNHPAEEVSLAQGVAAYRSEYLIDHGFGRLQGRSWSLTPRFLRHEQRVVALLCLLSIALRVLVLMPCVVRRNLRHASATLTGISPGQPGRQTAQPTTEMMRWALRGVTLSRITIDGKRLSHRTPLHAVQKRILVLMEVPREISDGLVT
jgi:transposase